MNLEVYDKGVYLGYVIIEPDILKTALMELIAVTLPDGRAATVFHIFGMDYGIVINNGEIADNIYAALECAKEEVLWKNMDSLDSCLTCF